MSVVNLYSIDAYEILDLFYDECSSSLDSKHVKDLKYIVGLCVHIINKLHLENLLKTKTLDKKLIVLLFVLRDENFLCRGDSSYNNVLDFINKILIILLGRRTLSHPKE